MLTITTSESNEIEVFGENVNLSDLDVGEDFTNQEGSSKDPSDSEEEDCVVTPLDFTITVISDFNR